MRISTVHILCVSASLAWLLPATGGVTARENSASPAPVAQSLREVDRLRCQRLIQDVYWEHTIWPEGNTGRRPPAHEAVPDEVIAARVRDSMLLSKALGLFWNRPVTPAQLQAELDRMARGSRQPRVLTQLFAALGDDPRLAAESIARPVLVERLARSWHARDPRFHAVARALAEETLALRPSLDAMPAGAERSVFDIDLRDPAGETAAGPIAVVARAFGLPDASLGAARSLPIGTWSPLFEQDDRFESFAVTSRTEDDLHVACLRWPKRSFDQWWESEGRSAVEESQEAHQVGDAGEVPGADGFVHTLPALPESGCVPDTWVPTHGELPDGRTDHTAVWTGTEMIVWGGYVAPGTYYLNTGGRYNPATDSWTRTSLGPNVPEARRYHTALWTGTRMIVWGGYGSAGTLGSGARYSPESDTWEPVPPAPGTLGKRYHHTAVWTGHEMIFWGGYDGSFYLKTGARFDPARGMWTATSTGTNSPVSRYLHKAVWTGTEMIVWGGGPGYMNTGGRYSPATNSWTATSLGTGLPSARTGHTAVWTGSEMIVWGGYASGGQTNTGSRYSPAGDAWTPTSTGPNVPVARQEHTAIWTGTMMIVWGGTPLLPTNTGGRYDPATDSWTATSTGAAVPEARGRHSAVWTGAEMLVWGGGNTYLDTGGRYAPATDSWVPTSIGTVPSARREPTAIWTGTSMIVWGGFTDTPQTYFNTGGIYTPAIDSWTATSTGAGVPAVRTRHTAVWTGTEMIVWGGYNGGSPLWLNTGGRYDPATGSWRSVSTGTGVPVGRYYHSAVWTGTTMIVWGGAGSSGRLNSGGRYDPALDEWSATGTGAGVPAGREGHSVVWTGSQMIVWGGYDGSSSLNTGGRYSPAGDSWTPTSLTGAPLARWGNTAVWTDSQMIVWGGGSTSTGGRYNPAVDSWLPTATGGATPSGRSDHTAVWSGTEMIVWGGYHLNTGGRYDPVANTWLPTCNGAGVPPPRTDHAAVWTGEADLQMIVWGGDPKTATGALYCGAPCTPVTWYRDYDGDGYGYLYSPYTACGRPAGYVSSSTDCDDASAASFPGNTEICDLKDNDCNSVYDDVVLPAGIAQVEVETWYGTSQIYWSAVNGAQGYDLVRGRLGTLAAGGGFTAATDACLANNFTDRLLADQSAPPAGDGYWYLVRPYNCAGIGSYDSGGPSQLGPRDAAINASALACP